MRKYLTLKEVSNMAMDRYTSGFDIADTLEDTLLNWVMSNRRLQENARQFNRNLEERKRQYDVTFGEDKRRYDIADQLGRDMRLGDKKMAEQILGRERVKEQIEKWDRSKKDYIESEKRKYFGIGEKLHDWNPFTDTGEDIYAREFEKRVGARPELRPMTLPDYPFMHSYGMDQSIISQAPYQRRTNFLNELMLGGR